MNDTRLLTIVDHLDANQLDDASHLITEILDERPPKPRRPDDFTALYLAQMHIESAREATHDEIAQMHIGSAVSLVMGCYESDREGVRL